MIIFILGKEGASISRDRFREILSKFEGKKVLVLGDLMLDQYLWGSASRISPEAPVPVVDVGSESTELGGAANVAENIASLKGSPILAGVIGDDPPGETLRRKLREKGIGSQGVFVEEMRPTTVKTRIVAHHQQVVRVDRESKVPLSSQTREKLVGFVTTSIDGIDALLFEDYDKGVLNPPTIRNLVDLAKSKGKVVTADPKFDHFFEYRGVDLFKPNQREVEAVMGIRLDDAQTLGSVGERLLKRLEEPALLLTRGENGMVLLQPKGDRTQIPTVAKEVFDVSGAGDTVIAVATLALASGASPKEAAIIANHAAGIEVSKFGVAPISFDELWEAI